jgi:acyl dehydratase
MRYFEDLRENDRLDSRDVLITKEEIVDFAKRFDPQPFHIDENGGNASIFGGIIASSLHTISACTRIVLEVLN